jgi:PIN domain nuclease of toxin-antitoxin system
MRLLLDTNILLALSADRQDSLGGRISEAIGSPGHVRFASVVSFWEIAIKRRTGKLDTIPPAELAELFDSMGVPLLAIEREHVVTELSILPATRDPFDRLLLAVCQVEGMRLVTLDRALAAHPLAWR